jgi:hypothetical protein
MNPIATPQHQRKIIEDQLNSIWPEDLAVLAMNTPARTNMTEAIKRSHKVDLL